MKLEEVLGYIPKGELERLSLTYNVDHQLEMLKLKVLILLDLKTKATILLVAFVVF